MLQTTTVFPPTSAIYLPPPCLREGLPALGQENKAQASFWILANFLTRIHHYSGSALLLIQHFQSFLRFRFQHCLGEASLLLSALQKWSNRTALQHKPQHNSPHNTNQPPPIDLDDIASWYSRCLLLSRGVIRFFLSPTFPVSFSCLVVELLRWKSVNDTRNLLSHLLQHQKCFQAAFCYPESHSESLFQNPSLSQGLRGYPKMSGPPNPPNPPTLEELVNGLYANPVALMPQWMSINADPLSGASSTTLDRLAHQLFNAPPQNPHDLPGWLIQSQFGFAPLGQLVGFIGYIPAAGQQAVVGLLPHLARFVPRALYSSSAFFQPQIYSSHLPFLCPEYSRKDMC